jgi:hypothetical protein
VSVFTLLSQSLVRIDTTEVALALVEASGVPVYARLESGSTTYFLAGASAWQAETLRVGGLCAIILDNGMEGAGY